MAELTKIFTGMEQGPEAIDANFTTLNNSTIKDSGWRQVSLTNSTGTVYIRRIGSNVITSGLFKPTGLATLSKTLDLFSIPSGFRPDVTKFKFYKAVAGAFDDPLRINLKADGSAVVMISTPANADKGEWQAGFSWTTNDDFPN